MNPHFELYDAFLIVIAVTSVAGVFSHVYPDTILQRVGMACICFGASIELACKFWEDCGNGRSLLVLVGGFAIFGIATTIKHWRKARRARLWQRAMGPKR